MSEVRLIDANALKTEFLRKVGGDFADIIDNAPTVEERPQGEWIYSQGSLKCSRCGYDDTRNHKANSNFCPNCGADMRGE